VDNREHNDIFRALSHCSTSSPSTRWRIFTILDPTGSSIQVLTRTPWTHLSSLTVPQHQLGAH